MNTRINKITQIRKNTSTAILIDNPNQVSHQFLDENETVYLKGKLEKEDDCTVFKYPAVFFFGKIKDTKDTFSREEAARKAGAKLFSVLKTEKIRSVQMLSFCQPGLMLPFLEGLLLAGYTFSKYKKEKEDFEVSEILILDEATGEENIKELQTLVKAVFHARNWVNEPLSYLTASQLSCEIEKLGEEAGFEVEIFNKKKIEALKMGGLLAVNKGSIDPPTFTILEWKPENANNKKPVILVGKGIVFDTGGLSLKPTPKSMDYMKCDMAGAAVVATAIYAAAKNHLPVHVIGLIPATDNRPDGNAYVPGDIITLFDGTTVEIKNTDAEGRLILADALGYAKKYSPQLVIDMATLTGAAEIVAGNQAAVGMGNTSEYLQKIKQAGEETYERIIEMPLWEEYAKSLKSQVADLNNLGAREAQSIVAGKFLEHFTAYPWIHLDMAGVSYFAETDSYIPAGGTGFGTRLIYNFLKKFN